MSKEQEKAARGVDSITDFVRDKEGDASKALQVLKSLTTTAKVEEKKPAVVVVKVAESDVTVLVNECEFSKEQAIDWLRKHNGDLKTALHAYINQYLP